MTAGYCLAHLDLGSANCHTTDLNEGSLTNLENRECPRDHKVAVLGHMKRESSGLVSAGLAAWTEPGPWVPAGSRSLAGRFETEHSIGSLEG